MLCDCKNIVVVIKHCCDAVLAKKGKVQYSLSHFRQGGESLPQSIPGSLRGIVYQLQTYAWGRLPGMMQSVGTFQNIRFVGIFIVSISCEFYYDDVTVTSFINIKYGVIAIEIVP